MTINWIAVAVSVFVTMGALAVGSWIDRLRKEARIRKVERDDLFALQRAHQERARMLEDRVADEQQRTQDVITQRDILGEAAANAIMAWHRACERIDEPSPIFDRLATRFALQGAHSDAEEAS